MKKRDLMDDAKLRLSGIDALNKALGPSAALRFLSLVQRDATDYVTISKKLYEGESLEEIFERAKENWQG